MFMKQDLPGRPRRSSKSEMGGNSREPISWTEGNRIQRSREEAAVWNVSCSSRRVETEGRWTPDLEPILTRMSFCNCRVETRRGWLESAWEEMKWSQCV